MNYLMNNIVDRRDHPFTEVVSFCADRFRAIRADYTCQLVSDFQVAQHLEIMARFHILAAHRCVEEARENFDQHQNMEKLLQCLISLRIYYRDLRLRGITSPNEAEIYCYEFLLPTERSSVLKKFLSMTPGALCVRTVFYYNRPVCQLF